MVHPIHLFGMYVHKTPQMGHLGPKTGVFHFCAHLSWIINTKHQEQVSFGMYGAPHPYILGLFTSLNDVLYVHKTLQMGHFWGVI